MTASGHTPAVALTLGEAPLSHVKPKKRDEELTLASKVGLPEGRHTPRWPRAAGCSGAEVNGVVEQRRRVLEVGGVVTADRLAARRTLASGRPQITVDEAGISI